MVRKGYKTRLTREDLAGLCLKRPTEDELAKEKKRLWASLLTRVLFYGITFATAVVLFLLMAPGVLSLQDEALQKAALILLAVFILIFGFLFFSLIFQQRNRIRLLNDGTIKCAHIMVLEKQEPIYSQSEGQYLYQFYPIKGCDPTTGYESIFYITSSQYEQSETHDVLTLFVYPDNSDSR